MADYIPQVGDYVTCLDWQGTIHTGRIMLITASGSHAFIRDNRGKVYQSKVETLDPTPKPVEPPAPVALYGLDDN